MHIPAEIMIGTWNRIIINDYGKKTSKFIKNWISTAILRNLLEITC